MYPQERTSPQGGGGEELSSEGDTGEKRGPPARGGMREQTRKSPDRVRELASIG